MLRFEGILSRAEWRKGLGPCPGPYSKTGSAPSRHAKQHVKPPSMLMEVGVSMGLKNMISVPDFTSQRYTLSFLTYVSVLNS